MSHDDRRNAAPRKVKEGVTSSDFPTNESPLDGEGDRPSVGLAATQAMAAWSKLGQQDGAKVRPRQN